MTSTILVTGSTGKTGYYVAKFLREKGYAVKAMARKRSSATKELEKLGAEIVLADFLDLASVEAALVGVDGAYFSYPPEDKLLEATANFIVAAKSSSLKTIVNMSQMPVRKYHDSPLSNQHWLAEQMLNLTDLQVTHICPGFFAEMLYLMNGVNILQEGKMYLPHGEAFHAPISGEDIGRSAAAIFDNPEQHNRQRYYLSGPVRLSQSDIAAIATEALGQSVEYVSVPYDQWATSMKQTGIFNDFVIGHLVEVGKDYQNDVFDMVTDTVFELTGQKPLDMKTYIENNRESFTIEYLQKLGAKMVEDLQST